MISAITEIYSTNQPRGIALILCAVIVTAMLIWVSIIDIKKMSITFWKMLLASSSIIIVPFIISLFYNCEKLHTMRWYIIAALPLWLFLLYANIKLNRDKFMGKADIDLLSCIAAIGITYSYWLTTVLDDMSVAIIKITGFWYSTLGYLLLGALIYLVIFIFFVITKVITKKKTMKELLKDTRISIIPMFIPVSVAVQIMILAS